MTEERLKIAVFVDFDNIEIGVKTTLGVAFDIGTILEAIKERGEVVTKVAYGDWTRAGDYSRLLTQHAIKMVQRNLTPGGDKNGADINLALDALEMALTHDHINAYVIVGGDSDFLSLVEKLKQYDKTVFVVGGRAFTSVILQRNCHEFIAYENIVNLGPGGSRRQPERGRSAGTQPVSQALPLVRRALKVLSEREVTPQLGLLKSTLLQLDSTFSEKNYGASSFRDFAEKLAQAGLLRLNQAGRNLLVEIKEVEAGSAPEEPIDLPSSVPVPDRAAVEREPHDRPHERPHGDRHAGDRQHGDRHSGDRHHGDRRPDRAQLERDARGGEAEQADEGQPPAAILPPAEALAAQQAEAIGMLRRVLEAAPAAPRWPMYVRNVKQLLRAAEAGFDERRYGFGGILDLLRGCQRENLLRLERDRQGVLRVFPGTALQRPSVQPAAADPAVGEPGLSSVAEPLPDAVAASGEVAESEPTPALEPMPEGEAAPGDASAGVDEAGEGADAAEADAHAAAAKPRRRRSTATSRKPAARTRAKTAPARTGARKKAR